MAVHEIKDTKRVILYGELFGGIYPGAEKVDKQPPQICIFYSPMKEYMLFDIAYDGGYLAYEQVVELSEKNGVSYVKPLFISEAGGLQTCIEFNNRFTTTIPAELGYKPPTEMPKNNPENLAEGIVIKPWDIETGHRNRPMLKLKIEEFNDNFKPQGDKKGKPKGELKIL